MSSSDGSSDFENLVDIPTVVPRKRRNIDIVEPAEGEANLKGFVSAFATMMARPVDEKVAVHKQHVEPVVAARKVAHSLSCHNKTPSLSEEAFEATAKRGVLKLFKAMSMHSRKKPKRAPRRAAVELTGTVGPQSMNSFLELLKAQKGRGV